MATRAELRMQRRQRAQQEERRLLISFSGGETSAYMTWWLLANCVEYYDRIVVVFANTGQEWEATLDFVRACDVHFGFGTVWLEAIQKPVGEGATFRVVDYGMADRSGVVFEDAIRKYGVPNVKWPGCTKWLKRTPIEAYARSLGWSPSSYDLAIGIRADEVDRLSCEKVRRRLVYPLVSWHPRTKPQINSWWAGQPFRLDLRSYQGNCKWCWKKSLRKHLTIARETPEVFDFPRRMEAEYGTHGAEFRESTVSRRGPPPVGYRRKFFRQGQSADDILGMAQRLDNSFVPADDDARVYDQELDMAGACSEGCEVFGDEEDT